jgi:type II secretory pathway component GspD/PulD (secretin)
MGSTQTDKVQTGLTLKTTPHFDADAELVTLDVNLELKSILQFVELKAGDQIGSITQPMTQDQSLTDIVRIQAGKTVVIGGLQYDSETKSNTEPAFLREEGEKSGMSFGQRGNQVQRNALFIIIRPSVTVYEPMD